jgi:hypothetical protein
MRILSRLPVRLAAVLAVAAGVLTVAQAPAHALAGVPENVRFVRIAAPQLDLTFVDRSNAEISFQIEYKQLGTINWRLARTVPSTGGGQPQSTGTTIRVNNLPLDAIGGCYKVWAVGNGGRVGTVQKCTAAVPYGMKLARVLSWTGSSTGSYNDWLFGLQNKSLYLEYNLDWQTNFCTLSPDQPAGYDFRTPCRRHDFGYGNFTRLNVFSQYKSRADNSFLADLNRKCDTYAVVLRPPCYGLATLYYEAVVIFGFTSSRVSQAEIDRHTRWRADIEAKHTAAALR